MRSLPNPNGQNGNGKNGTHRAAGAPGGANVATQSLPVLATQPETEEQPHPPSQTARFEAFDQPVVLQQTSLWSRAIVWGIVGVTSFTVLWASLARIEEAVPAQGKLEPQGQVQVVQAPVGGVVAEILVNEGDAVKQGQTLVRFDTRAADAQLKSLQQIMTKLQQENEFYRSQLVGTGNVPLPADLPPEIFSLTRNRAALIAENNLYRSQLAGVSPSGLPPEQRARLATGLAQSDALISAARLEVLQLQGQLRQAEMQLAAARETLQIDRSILERVRPLVEDGALARVQLERQQQEVIQGQVEVDRFSQEMTRLNAAIAQANQRVTSTTAEIGRTLLDRMAANDQQIATIDSQLNKQIVENEKRMSEIQTQMVQAKLTQDYQDVRAERDGVVFDLQPRGRGFVANTSEPILKIVPADNLVAEVFITNQDIGFVREGMEVDVRIDSFPFSEFGDIKGELVRIGSDALPPDQVHQFWRFPAKIKLDSQTLNVEGTPIDLQSGMSISANIITRDRTVLSIFTDLFSRRIESLKNVR